MVAGDQEEPDRLSFFKLKIKILRGQAYKPERMR